MNEESFSRILGNCLDRMAAGENVAACLARYPQYAGELAPLLAAAAEVSALAGYRISAVGRQRARAAIVKAEVARNNSPRPILTWPAFGFAVPRLAMGVIAALICVVLSTAVVAASQPGDLAYGVRVAAERAPVLLARGAEARARAELGLAERRLGDLDRTRSSQVQVVDERAAAALVYSAEQAASLAVDLPGAQRAYIAARLAEHAAHLAQLEATAPAGSRAAFQAASSQVQRAADRAQLPPKPPVPGPVATSTPEPSATPQATSPRPAHSATVRPTRGAAATAGPQPSHTAAPQSVGPQASATPQRLGPSATQHGPNASATPLRSGWTATPQVPGAISTPQGPGHSATPQGPGSSATPQGPGSSATPPGPGPNPTSPGPIETPKGPGPDPTSPGPGPSATPQGPGQSATPQGPGPTGTPHGSGPSGTPQGPGPGGAARTPTS